jgi:alpha-L-fucosidase
MSTTLVGLHLRTGIITALAFLGCWSNVGCSSVERSLRDEQVTTDRLAWWREARFGMFVHWGLYAIPAGEWNGRTDYGEWIRANAGIPLAEYDKFAPRFDPQRFDADRWARLAADAGMKYMVVTTKHHDGFGMFDSKATDWDVMSTPFKRDVMAEVASACSRNGVVPCWYYSIMDWHHDDYLPRRAFETDRPELGADYDRYESYLHTQVTELLTKYGPIGVMWFDGEWESTWTSERGQRLYDLCRRLQPNVIVNNRVGAGRAGMSGFATGAETSGDFGTPEQHVPNARLSGIDWESCITMNDNWGFNAHDKNFKSTRTLLRTLVDVASKGGNLLLNVGPDANGEIPRESVERLEAIGRWMKTNGVAIHKTSACPVDPPAFGRLTAGMSGGNTQLYVHVFDWPKDGRFTVAGFGNTVLGARLLADPARPIEIRGERGRMEFSIAGGAPDADVSVVEVRLAGEPLPYLPPLIETESDLFVDEAVVTVAPPARALEARYTLDGSEPTLASALANGPIAIADSVVIRARTFHGADPVGEVVARKLVRTQFSPAVTAEAMQRGLEMRVSTGTGERLDAPWTAEPPVLVVDGVKIPRTAAEREHVRYDFKGFLRVDTDAVYGFRLESDDGSRLFIDGRLVCDNDGRHAPTVVDGSIALSAGWHAISVEYCNVDGSGVLELRAGKPGHAMHPIPPERFAHRAAAR